MQATATTATAHQIQRAIGLTDLPVDDKVGLVEWLLHGGFADAGESNPMIRSWKAGTYGGNSIEQRSRSVAPIRCGSVRLIMVFVLLFLGTRQYEMYGMIHCPIPKKPVFRLVGFHMHPRVALCSKTRVVVIS